MLIFANVTWDTVTLSLSFHFQLEWGFQTRSTNYTHGDGCHSVRVWYTVTHYQVYAGLD
jgi:hypothetical protein